MEMSGLPQRDTGTISGEDNHFYLKELKPYEDSVRTRGYVQAVDKGNEVTFTFPLNAGTADSRLYSKFVVTVWDGYQLRSGQPAALHYQSGKRLQRTRIRFTIR